MLLVTAQMPAPDTGGTMKNEETGTSVQAPELQALELLRLHSALERAEASFKLLFEASPEALMRFEGGHFTDCNPAALELFGVPSTSVFRSLQASDLSPLHQPCGTLSGQMLQEHFASAIHRRRYRCDWVCRRLDTGIEFPCEIVMHATGTEADAALLLAVHVRSNSEDDEKQAEMAYHDPLTHLPNRRLFYDRLINVLAHSRRYGRRAAIIAIDVAPPPPALDTALQQEVQHIEELLLCEAAQRISALLRSADTIARFALNQFIVLLGDMAEDPATANADALRVAEKICSSFATRCQLTLRQHDGTHRVIGHDFRVSLGVAVFTAQEVLAEEFLQQAIAAMQRARAEGCNLIRLSTAP